MKTREERQKERINQRLHDAYLMGLRARNFSPAEMIRQADQLIDFAISLSKINLKMKNNG